MKLRAGAVFIAFVASAWAGAVHSQTLSTFGSPGLIDLPTAQVLEDGEVALTTNYFGNNTRNTLTFQILPRVYGSFRYSVLRNFREATPTAPADFYDRSFDVHFQLAYETETSPGLAFGLRGFGGTGRLTSEYIGAT